jgi:hypothetical protein
MKKRPSSRACIACRGHDHEPDTSTRQVRVTDRVRQFRKKFNALIRNIK